MSELMGELDLLAVSTNDSQMMARALRFDHLCDDGPTHFQRVSQSRILPDVGITRCRWRPDSCGTRLVVWDSPGWTRAARPHRSNWNDLVVCNWWTAWDSNPRPRHCERRALPTELAAHGRDYLKASISRGLHASLARNGCLPAPKRRSGRLRRPRWSSPRPGRDAAPARP